MAGAIMALAHGRGEVAAATEQDDRRLVLRRHAEMIVHGAREGLPETQDRLAVEEHFTAIAALLGNRWAGADGWARRAGREGERPRSYAHRLTHLSGPDVVALRGRSWSRFVRDAAARVPVRWSLVVVV